MAAPAAHGADEDRDSDPSWMDYDENPLGHADAQGRLSIWYEYGDSVEFGEALEFTVRLHFSGAPGVTSPYLGRGWQFPLLESSVTFPGDNTAHVLLPSGGTLVLRRDPASPDDAYSAGAPPDTYHSPDQRWSGVGNNGDFTLTNTFEGWEIHFVRGAIRVLICGPRALEWIYEGDRVTGVRLQGKTRADFTVTYDDERRISGFVSNGNQVHFKFADFPHAAAPSAPPGQTLCQVDDREPFVVTAETGKPWEVNFEAEDVGRLHCTYDPATGRIMTENDWRYIISAPKNAGDPPVITRVDSKGEYEYVASEIAKGIQCRRMPELGAGNAMQGGDLIYTWPLRAGVPVPDLDQPAVKQKRLADGLYHTVLKVGRDARGNTITVLRVDDWGATHLTTYGDGHNATSKTIPSEPVFAPISAAKENELLAAVAASGTATPTPSGKKRHKGDPPAPGTRNDAVQNLAYFYNDLGETGKALALLPELNDESRFNVRIGAIFSDSKLTIAGRIRQLRQLEDEYPAKKGEIEKRLESVW